MAKPTIQPAEDLFKPRLSTAEKRARNTEDAARTITEAEAASRASKTARLREARMARDAEAGRRNADAPAKKGSGRKKPSA
jgi:hypothetical protein